MSTSGNLPMFGGSNSSNNKPTITSIELVKQVNLFRNEEGNRTEIQHKTLLAIIEDEFSKEIGEQKILPTSYTDKSNRQSKCYELTIPQATRVLVRESKYVRGAIVAYLEQKEQTPMSESEILLRSIQLLVNLERNQRYLQENQERLGENQDDLDRRVRAIEESQAEASEQLSQLPISNEPLPEETMRAKISRLVYNYSASVKIDPQEVWRYVYSRLYDLYRVAIRSYTKVHKKETLLEVAERKGHLDKIYNIISDLIRKNLPPSKLA